MTITAEMTVTAFTTATCKFLESEFCEAFFLKFFCNVPRIDPLYDVILDSRLYFPSYNNASKLDFVHDIQFAEP